MINRKMGLKSLTDPKRDLFPKFMPDEATRSSLPTKLDYSWEMPPVQDQQQIGSCVSWGSAKLLEFYHRKRHNIKSLVSARAIYSQAKHEFAPADLTDDGLNVSDGLHIISQNYVNESDYPSLDAQSEAQFPEWVAVVPDNLKKTDYLVHAFAAVNTTVLDLKLALYKHGIVILGMAFANEWMNTDSTGRLQSSNLTVDGGHCMTVVGFDDEFLNLDGSRGAFKISNQWSANFGDHGYIYLPYNVDPNFFPTDLFTVTA